MQTMQTVDLIAETVTRTAMRIVMSRTAQKISLPTKQQTATDRINPDRTVQVLTYQNKNTGTGNCI
ncbi:hypothetical protein ROSINTL182_05582 [Roseburia intestinalis L1-82]|jgi:hypothetical protein|uniref:Uncharacterized protein n=1 Tax=Roseburia intestinalis L1-82 TaxID=536231 RepID=C7G6R7_9FIRM|nr:hypothetical protein ROSINTL182_05582 [Roseburia intestinalis L1-82]